MQLHGIELIHEAKVYPRSVFDTHTLDMMNLEQEDWIMNLMDLAMAIIYWNAMQSNRIVLCEVSFSNSVENFEVEECWLPSICCACSFLRVI